MAGGSDAEDAAPSESCGSSSTGRDECGQYEDDELCLDVNEIGEEAGNVRRRRAHGKQDEEEDGEEAAERRARLKKEADEQEEARAAEVARRKALHEEVCRRVNLEVFGEEALRLIDTKTAVLPEDFYHHWPAGLALKQQYTMLPRISDNRSHVLALDRARKEERLREEMARAAALSGLDHLPEQLREREGMKKDRAARHQSGWTSARGPQRERERRECRDRNPHPPRRIPPPHNRP